MRTREQTCDAVETCITEIRKNTKNRNGYIAKKDIISCSKKYNLNPDFVNMVIYSKVSMSEAKEKYQR